MNSTLMLKKILICDRFSIEALIQLKKNSDFQIISAQTKELLESNIAAADGIIIRSGLKVDSTLLNQAPELKVIVTCTSGFDHIDLIETKKRNITVMFTPDANQISAAEHTWALLLACARKISQADQKMKAKNWNREAFLGFELHDKILGIVGLGRIGMRVAKIAQAFNMRVLAFDPYCNDSNFTDANAERASFEELLKQVDVVSFHVPGTKETKNMLNRIQFEIMNPNAVVINTSRGSVIHEDDLADALIDKKIKAAALDVFEKEPLDKNSKLFKCQNVILTPHLGAYTEEAFNKASLQGASQIENYFMSQKIQNALPLVNDWGSMSFQEGN